MFHLALDVSCINNIVNIKNHKTSTVLTSNQKPSPDLTSTTMIQSFTCDSREIYATEPAFSISMTI